MGQAILRIDANVANAVQGLLKVAESNARMETSFGRAVKSGRNMDRNLQQLKSAAFSLAASFAGAGGVRMAISAFVNVVKEASTETIKFESEMTGLLSLGDNIENIGKMKNQVLGLAGAFGVSRKEMATTLFNLQSGSAGLAESIQKDVLQNTLELARVTGAELPTAMNALLKTFRIYGDEAHNVNQIQNILFTTAERGYLTFQDMGTYLPDLAAAANTFGISLEEVGASLIVATGQLGKTEKTMTGLRNVFLRMSKAQEEGIQLTDNMVENFRRLSAIEPDQLKKIFGDEAIAVVSALTRGTSQINEELARLKGLTGDIAQEKYIKRLGDMSFAYANMAKSISEMQHNIMLSEDVLSKFGKEITRFELKKLGLFRVAPWMKGMPEWIQNLSAMTGGPELETAGYRLWRRRMVDAGMIEEADIQRKRVYGEAGPSMGPGFKRAERAEYTPAASLAADEASMNVAVGQVESKEDIMRWHLERTHEAIGEMAQRYHSRADSGPMADPGSK